MKAHTIHISSNYTGTSSELSGCLNDGKDLYALCRPKVASATKVMASKSDREGWVKNFRKVRHRLENPGDTLFITISGHGTREYVGGRYVEAFVCDDFELIYDHELADECADRAPGTFIIALLDCCHSGLIHRGLPKRALRSIPVSRCRTHKAHAPEERRALPNCGFIAGCEADGYSYDGEFNGRPNGALTYYAIQAAKALKGKQPTFNDLFRKIGGRGGALPSDLYPQQPTKMGSKNNFSRRVPFL